MSDRTPCNLLLSQFLPLSRAQADRPRILDRTVTTIDCPSQHLRKHRSTSLTVEQALVDSQTTDGQRDEQTASCHETLEATWELAIGTTPSSTAA